jgi:hypothetical protein
MLVLMASAWSALGLITVTLTVSWATSPVTPYWYG